ncbi:hypothetical protein B0H34DRAFT_833127 [Crassisporium funariophilum]|nr:hypothetical protein B0H34DRAFT_833127 [Crassisporium funariophilum]
MSTSAPKGKCYCQRCQGALVSRKTFLKHTKAQGSSNQTILGFRDWLAGAEGSSTAGDIEMGDEDNPAEDNPAEDEDEQRTGVIQGGERPQKRLRAEQAPEQNVNYHQDIPAEPNLALDVDYNDIYVDEPIVPATNEGPRREGHVEDPAAIDQEGDLNPEENDLAVDNPIADVDEL